MYDMSKPMPYPNNPKEFTLKNLLFDFYISVKKTLFFAIKKHNFVI